VDAGIVVSILTGRLYSGTRRAAAAAGILGAVGCVDGSQLVEVASHKTLVHQGICGDHALALRDVLARRGPATFLFAKDAIVHDRRGHDFVAYVSTWSDDVRSTNEVSAHEFWHHDDGITAVVAVGTREQIHGSADEIQRDLAGHAQAVVFPIRQRPGQWGMIARAAGSTKGSALAWLAEHYRVRMADTVVVGDWLNDLSMFAVAGRSFAMGQAPDEVKMSATDVLQETSAGGGGIARIINEVFGVSI
jgi:hydroxymethylpyrimidine pyrophosphatase-like HAD family hydrolase